MHHMQGKQRDHVVARMSKIILNLFFARMSKIILNLFFAKIIIIEMYINNNYYHYCSKYCY